MDTIQTYFEAVISNERQPHISSIGQFNAMSFKLEFNFNIVFTTLKYFDTTVLFIIVSHENWMMMLINEMSTNQKLN